MRMFRVIAVGFLLALLAAPIGAQAQGVPRGMNYGAHAVPIPVTARSDRSVALLVGLLAERLVESLEASTACSESILILTGITAAIGTNPEPWERARGLPCCYHWRRWLAARAIIPKNGTTPAPRAARR
jgi:hypothetical protein